LEAARCYCGVSDRPLGLALGVGRDFFNECIRPELKLIRRGRLVLVLVSELERWGRRTALSQYGFEGISEVSARALRAPAGLATGEV
jgi:hypothetical protein